MFNTFVAGLMEKIFHFLINHPDLFKSENKKRAEMLEGLKLSKLFKEYLLEVSEKHFMQDMAQALKFAHGEKDFNAKNNKFLEKVAEFFTTEIAFKIDMIESGFYLMSAKERRDIVDALIPGESEAAISMKDILVNFSYQQIANEIYKLSSSVKETPYVLIQVPREIDHQLKKDIRKKFLEKHPLSFPFFQINRKLIGGIRIFMDGKTVDNSWLSRVLRFASLTSV